MPPHWARWCSHESTTPSLPYQGTSAGSLNVRTRLMLQQRGRQECVVGVGVQGRTGMAAHGRVHAPAATAARPTPQPCTDWTCCALAECQQASKNAPVKHAVQHHMLRPIQQRAAQGWRADRHGGTAPGLPATSPRSWCVAAAPAQPCHSCAAPANCVSSHLLSKPRPAAAHLPSGTTASPTVRCPSPHTCS